MSRAQDWSLICRMINELNLPRTDFGPQSLRHDIDLEHLQNEIVWC